MKDSEDIQRLIRLKRYETPGDDYFESFLEEFKDRQRSELLHRSARGLLLERLTMWFDELNGTKWLIPLGATAAIAALGIYIARPELSENGGPATNLAASTTTAPETLEAEKEDVILLQLPRQNNRVPGLGANGLSGVQGLLPAGARENFREL